jgi:membrane dipeptidase
LLRADGIRLVRDVADLDACLAGEALGAILHMDGAEAIDPELDMLEVWYAAGPRLTEAGVRLVRRCAELGIAVDVSHLNAAGFWDVAREYDGPLVASHSGVHALCPAARNLTDEQLDAIDLVGINFDVGALRADGGDDPDTPVARIAEHARYIAYRCGVDHVALGSDFDGATMPAEVPDAAALPRVLAALEAAGFEGDELERIAWG